MMVVPRLRRPHDEANPCISKDPATAAPSASASRRRARCRSCIATARSAARPRAAADSRINLGAKSATLKVRGEKHLSRYHALLREPGKRARRSPATRHFCRACGSPLWLYDPRWPELVHPHASAIDTPLPKPNEVVEAALAFAPAWVDVPSGKGHVRCREWPKESLEDWHRRHGVLSE